MSTGEDAREAIDRARTARAQANVYLSEVRETSQTLRNELRVNHLAEDVYASMRRKR